MGNSTLASPGTTPGPPIHRRNPPASTPAMPATSGPPNSPAMLSTAVRASRMMPVWPMLVLSMPKMQALPNQRPASSFCGALSAAVPAAGGKGQQPAQREQHDRVFYDGIEGQDSILGQECPLQDCGK